jgi:hypothetical protein
MFGGAAAAAPVGTFGGAPVFSAYQSSSSALFAPPAAIPAAAPSGSFGSAAGGGGAGGAGGPDGSEQGSDDATGSGSGGGGGGGGMGAGMYAPSLHGHTHTSAPEGERPEGERDQRERPSLRGHTHTSAPEGARQSAPAPALRGSAKLFVQVRARASYLGPYLALISPLSYRRRGVSHASVRPSDLQPTCRWTP